MDIKISFGSKLSGVRAVVSAMAPGSVYIVSDANVRKYADAVAQAISGDDRHPVKSVTELEASEERKTMETVLGLAGWLMDSGADRRDILIAVGGGITTDMAGFAASIYKRGIRFAYVPTTLLAQTDAAIGGKTGVNFQSYKNMLGVINQPEFTYICREPLLTLSERDLLSGASEMVKSFIIEDGGNYRKAVDLLAEMRKPRSEEGGPDGDFISLVAAAAKVKAGVVSRDQFENGERRKLNLGHTFAHAMEWCARKTGYSLTHGEAVSAGMILAAELSEALGYAGAGFAKSLEQDFEKAGLRVSVPFPLTELAGAMAKDKKAEGSIVHFVLIEKIGSVIIADMSVDDAVSSIEKFRRSRDISQK